LERKAGASHTVRESGSLERLDCCKDQTRSEGRWTFDDQHPPKRSRFRKKARLIERKMDWSVRPIGDFQSPSLREVFSDGSYQCIRQRLSRRFRNNIDPFLLGNFVGIIEIEFVRELVQRYIDLRRIKSGSSRYIRKCLWPQHSVIPVLCECPWRVPPAASLPSEEDPRLGKTAGTPSEAHRSWRPRIRHLI
jgi:hypothetical protein